MNIDSRENKIKKVLYPVQIYLCFFLLISVAITGCMILFLHSTTANIRLISEEEIKYAARITFANILLLSLICTVIDGIRRKFMVERPVKRIINAADKIMNGDFSARIEPIHSIDSMDKFDIIIEYFNKMAEELSRTEALRTDFTANVAHELKTPLAVMQNYATMLQQPNLSEEKRLEYAKAINDASCRLASMVSNILKLNRLENQQIFPMKQIYNLGEQLCECMLSFETIWEDKELNIDTDIEEDVFVNTDAEMMTLVWNNLFQNAIKFTKSNGNILLKLKTEGDFAVVQVMDTGCGISREVGQHIFEKFYQGDTSHAAQGNGLGLALVKRVIEIIGGDISVESEVGKGSTFTVKLRRELIGTI